MSLVDREGIAALSMRKLASALGIEAMSVYHYVKNKDELLDAMVERVMEQVYLPASSEPWMDEQRKRARSVFESILEHPWVASLFESRQSGPHQFAANEAVLANLRHHGFSVALAHRSLLTIDSYVYGFALQEAAWPHERSQLPDILRQMLPRVSEASYPRIVEFMQHMMAFSRELERAEKGSQEISRSASGRSSAYREEFEFGLQLILDGLERVRSEQALQR